MWKKNILAGVLFVVLMSCANALQLGSNLTLRAECVDSYGNLCTDTARWTVILPNSTTIYNNSLGGVTSYGINNFTVWFNATGIWFVTANFSSQNVTHEWNIVVEDYGIASLQEDFAMTGIYILFGIIIFTLLYAAFMFGKEHQTLKWLLALVAILLMPIAVQIARLGSTNAMQNDLFDTAMIVFEYIVVAVLFYMVIYSIYVIVLNKSLTKTGGKK
jgi:hypothetical protein